jgi:hypothetical protein
MARQRQEPILDAAWRNRRIIAFWTVPLLVYDLVWGAILAYAASLPEWPSILVGTAAFLPMLLWGFYYGRWAQQQNFRDIFCSGKFVATPQEVAAIKAATLKPKKHPGPHDDLLDDALVPRRADAPPPTYGRRVAWVPARWRPLAFYLYLLLLLVLVALAFQLMRWTLDRISDGMAVYVGGPFCGFVFGLLAAGAGYEKRKAKFREKIQRQS